MNFEAGQNLVTIAKFGKEAIGNGSEIKYYSMAEEPIDYETDWGLLG